ncbi:CchlT, partial [Streptomyces sp. SID7982]|nr:CchlT [Streptomyces sp. SID7982]
NRRRAERGVVLGPLDTALLKYTGQYLHGATIPKRMPDAVDPALLPEVMRVLATAERACAGMRIGRDPRRGKRATDKRDWSRMETAVDSAVRRAHPELA